MENLDKILDSIEGMEKAKPSARFTQNVLDKWQGVKKLKTIPMRTVWSVAAAIALLIAVNVWVGLSYSAPEKQRAKNNVKNVVNAYGLNEDVFSY